jgi:uncharacterized membrane protein
MKSKKGKLLLASAAAGLMTFAMAAGAAHAEDAAAPAKVKCYGVNSCKGTGECGGKGYSCHGNNECAGKGWISKASAEECLAIKNGRLTPDAEGGDEAH